MESKKNFKRIDIKNHTYYYFDYLIADSDINFNNNL